MRSAPRQLTTMGASQTGMYIPWRHLGGFLFLLFALWLHWSFANRLVAATARRYRPVILAGTSICGLWLVAAFLMGVRRFDWLWPDYVLREWTRGAALVWTLCLFCWLAIDSLRRRLPAFDPGRRKLLLAARGALFAAPVAAAGFGVLAGRSRLVLNQVDIAFGDLPADLNGLRIAQLTDIHLGPFLELRELERAVAMANEAKPNLVVVTGDLITARAHHLERCLRALAGLRSEAGVLGCLGNHEMYAACEDEAQRSGARLGILFLRHSAERLRFGNAYLNVAGADHQADRRSYLAGAEALIRPDDFNVLLSHNPDVFPVAARQGYDLTLAGHTHGGQVTIEALSQYLNVARFATPFVRGLYRENRSAVYVGLGIGTVGVPARLGSPPEVALIRLCGT